MLYGSKNNPGGLHHKRVGNKEVPCCGNASRNFVTLYEKYISNVLQMQNFYFYRVRKYPSRDCWCNNRVTGPNTLGGTVKRLAGIPGKKMNHSSQQPLIYSSMALMNN